jgi:hypothetical protein
LKVGELVSVNGNTDLSKIITGSDKAKIDWIKLEKASGIKGKLYSHSVKVYGRGPKGILAGNFYLYFTDQSGDTYELKLWSSSPGEHEVSFTSNAPYINKITWKD